MRRFLDRLRPDLAVLMEGDVWPNFVLECARRRIPVVLVNARQTERAHRQYRMVRPFISRIYSRFAAVCAQEELYAQRLIALGVPADRMRVTGTMKFDSAQLGERVEGDEELARELGLRPRALGGSERILVCGSTGPAEEELLLMAYQRLKRKCPRLRVVLVPRKPERFDEVVRIVTEEAEENALRRSRPTEIIGNPPQKIWGAQHAENSPRHARQVRRRAVIVGDTMGELRKFYSLADFVVVGRTLIDLGEKQHGSDMIEPAALGKPVVVGPWTGNFAEPMRALLAADAIRQIGGGTPQAPAVQSGAPPVWAPKSAPHFSDRPSPIVDELVSVLEGWLRNSAEAAGIGRRAREVVLANRGATARNVAVLIEHLRSGS